MDGAPPATNAKPPSAKNSNDDDEVKSEMFLKLKFKVKDKNAKDLFMVSKYLQGSVRGALMGVIKKTLGVLDPKVVKGIDSSLQESFKNIQRDAVHIGTDESEKEIFLEIPL